MTKSPPGDRRRDDPDRVTPEHLIDRVFPAAPSRAPAKQPTRADPESTLRHQVVRLQRELGEAQRKLADHDDELTAERALRMAVTSARRELLDQYDAQVQALAAAERAIAELTARCARLEASQATLAPVQDRLVAMTAQCTRLDSENGQLGQRLSTAVMAVEVLTQEARVLRDRACALQAPAPTPAPAVRHGVPIDDDLGEEELRILYGDD